MGELDDALRADRERAERASQEQAAAQRRGVALISEFIEAMKDRPRDTITKKVTRTTRVKTGMFRTEEQREVVVVDAQIDGWVLQARRPSAKDVPYEPEIAVTRSGQLLVDGKPCDVDFRPRGDDLEAVLDPVNSVRRTLKLKSNLLSRLKRRP